MAGGARRGSLATGDLERPAVQRALDLGEIDAVTGKRGEREIQHVGGLVNHLSAPAASASSAGFLAQLGAEQRRIGEQLGGVGAVRGGDPAFREAACERTKAAVVAPTGARVQVQKPGGCWRTVKRRQSRSQSASIRSSSWVAPDVAPLTHRPRERER